MFYSWLLVTQSGSDAIKELFEIDLASLWLEVGDHVENGGVFGLKAQTLHGWFQLSWIDLTCCLGIE